MGVAKTTIHTQLTPEYVDSRIAMYLGRPIKVQCEFCKSNIITRVKHEVSCASHSLCCLGFWLSGGACCPCSFAVYCIDSSKSAVHYCSACNRIVGEKKVC